MSEEMKMPQPGEWWCGNITRNIVFIAGKTANGTLLYEDSSMRVFLDNRESGGDWSKWHHEPRCTGWDWVEPVESPDGVVTKKRRLRLWVNNQSGSSGKVFESPEQLLTSDQEVKCDADGFYVEL